MCEFCIQHGEGKIWYLAMKNYSQELLHHDDREHFIVDFLVNFERSAASSLALLDRTKKSHAMHRLVRTFAENQQKKTHFGQVLPLEDALQVVDLADAVVRLPCVCRKMTTGREERYCYGLTYDPMKKVDEYPDFNGTMEKLQKEEAKVQIDSLDKKGMIHSVWTFKTPYIGAICNCDQDCVAYRMQVTADLLKVMFKGEYIAAVDADSCNGCRNCQRQCQFGAVTYSLAADRCGIDARLCYGCGVCRALCPKDAISLQPRQEMAGVRDLW